MSQLSVLLDQQNEDNANISQEEEHFRAYWSKIEKAEKSYKNAERKRGQIFDRFNEVLLPTEQSYCQSSYQLIQKLVSFFPKKSFSKDEKKELIDWVCHELESLSGSPFRGDIDLSELHNQVHSYEIEHFPPSEHDKDILKRMFSDALGGDVDFDEEVESLFSKSDADPFKFMGSIFEKLQQQMEDEILNKEHSDYREDSGTRGSWFDGEEQIGHEQNSVSEDITSERSINRLYKKLAQKLHPDRAENDQDREHRHEVMLKLSEAKRTGDLYSLLCLVRDYGDEMDAQFSSDQLDQVTDKLREKLYDLKSKRTGLREDGSISAAIYKRFNGRSKRAIEEKMLDRRSQLLDEIDQIKVLIAHLKKPKQLKDILRSRLRDRRFEELQGFRLFEFGMEEY